MTTHDFERDGEPPIIGIVQREAQRIAQNICDMLTDSGWELCIVSLCRRVDIDETSAAPGATAMNCNARRMRPALGNEAMALRHLAGELDKMADGAAVTSQYVHDISNHAANEEAEA